MISEKTKATAEQRSSSSCVITFSPVIYRVSPKSCSTASSSAAASAIENSPTSSGPRNQREITTEVANMIAKLTYCEAIAQIAAWPTLMRGWVRSPSGSVGPAVSGAMLIARPPDCPAAAARGPVRRTVAAAARCATCRCCRPTSRRWRSSRSKPWSRMASGEYCSELARWRRTSAATPARPNSASSESSGGSAARSAVGSGRPALRSA